MKKVNISLVVLIIIPILIFVASGCKTQSGPNIANTNDVSSSGNKEILVFAGSTSKGALEPAAKEFENKTGKKVFFNFGGSGNLLSQMKISRTGDLYLPASPDYIKQATTDNIIDPETEVKIYYLVPAIIVQDGNPSHIESLIDLAKPGLTIAICDPQNVPAGRYAYEILEYNNLLSAISNNIITYSDSNEKVSALVILKSVDAAIAFDIVAVQQPDKLDVINLHPEQVPRLSYFSGAITTFTKDKSSSQEFLDFLVSSNGQAIFEQNGYYTNEEEAKKYAPSAQIGGEYNLPEDYKPLVK